VGSEIINSLHQIPQKGMPIVFLSRNADLQIDNSLLISWGFLTRGGSFSGTPRSSGVSIIGGRLVLNNSYIQLHSDIVGDENQTVIAINSNLNPQISFNDSVVYRTSWDPSEGSLIRTNSFRPNLSVGDAVFTPKGVRIASAPPIAVAWTNQWDFQVSLVPNSPLINAGSEDPLKRNRDGSRNTIGSKGGPMYNPALATTDLPMAFWLGLMPQRIVKGLVNTVDLDAAAAAGH
jgi:hypothetical protein